MLSQPAEDPDPSVRLNYEEALRRTEVELKAELGRTRLSIEEILELSEGDVIALDRRISDPINVVVGNIPQFKALIGKSGTRKALRITEIIQTEETEDDDASNV
jgi:flagellar motor switch protein FliM